MTDMNTVNAAAKQEKKRLMSMRVKSYYHKEVSKQFTKTSDHYKLFLKISSSV
jgi:hypothetical protein